MRNTNKPMAMTPPALITIQGLIGEGRAKALRRFLRLNICLVAPLPLRAGQIARKMWRVLNPVRVYLIGPFEVIRGAPGKQLDRRA